MSTAEIHVGRHEMALSNNVASIALRGGVSGEEVRVLVQTLSEWFPPDETCFVICNSREMTTLAPEGRKLFATWIQQRRAAEHVAYYGVSFAVGTVIFLLTNAARLLGRTPNVKTFETEAEARTWLASLGARTGS